MKNFKQFIMLISFLFLFAASSCNKKENDNHDTLQHLFEAYEDGEINECYYEGKLVYSAGINAADAGLIIYDQKGAQLGTCNYAWNQVDEICEGLANCETVYRVNDNIWGKPEVDKYGLGQ